jgi:hypothetical protein
MGDVDRASYTAALEALTSQRAMSPR